MTTGTNWLSSRAAGRMNSSLLRRDPIAIRLIIGSSRSAVMPCTYCGVTAVSSMTTPAALAVARPVAAPMSSTEAAANRASAATSSRRPNRPALIASPPWHRTLPGGHVGCVADDRDPSTDRLEARRDDGRPLGEIPVVWDAGFAAVNQAGRKPCPEDPVHSERGEDFG